MIEDLDKLASEYKLTQDDYILGRIWAACDKLTCAIWRSHKVENRLEEFREEMLVALPKIIAAWDPAKLPFKAFFGICAARMNITVYKRKCAEGRYHLVPIPSGEDDQSCPPSTMDPDPGFIVDESINSIIDRIDLTPLEEKVLRLVLQGASLIGAAYKLGVSEKSADNAITRARDKAARWMLEEHGVVTERGQRALRRLGPRIR